MKLLLVTEYRDGKALAISNDLIAFAEKMGAASVMMMVGSEASLPGYAGKLYLADVAACGEYNPDVHKQLVLDVVAQENPDMIVFSHSSYGWDLAPRIACTLKAAQISEVISIENGKLVMPACNAKLRRTVTCTTAKTVVTVQAGAFSPTVPITTAPQVEKITTNVTGKVKFGGYEAAAKTGVDLTKAEIIVSAGRGIGKPENVAVIAALAEALGGEYGASRPVVDNGWVEHNRQVGTTGQTVSPKMYVACGISGAVQHLAGMKKSEFIVAINTDKDAPIGEVADVLVVADLMQFIPALTAKIKSL